MHGYKEFPNDVKECFGEIIRKYGFQIVSESELEVELKSEHCIVQVFTEYDYAEFIFKTREEERWIFLGVFIQHVYPEEQLSFPVPPDFNEWTRPQKIKATLRSLALLAAKYCHTVFNGDFSLIEKYKRIRWAK